VDNAPSLPCALSKKPLKNKGFFLLASIYKKSIMSVFRTYFSKNNTLIDGNLTNNSQNPVSEVSYGTVNSFPSRLIFALDFSDLHQRIADGFINPVRFSI